MTSNKAEGQVSKKFSLEESFAHMQKEVIH